MSVWVVVAVAVTAVALIAVVVFLVFAADDEGTPAADVTTTPEASSTSTMPTTAEDQTTTSTASTTTTVAPEVTENPFVGWWRLAGNEGRSVDLRIGVEGEILMWDSASSLCVNDGIDSPHVLEGFSTFKPFGTPTLAITGAVTCHLYGLGQQPTDDQLLVFTYNSESDAIELAEDGVRFERSPSVPGLPVDASNPFVGSWEGTDSDLTHVEMTVLADGSWLSTDTRSGGCERKGFTYATWSAEGSGAFDLNATPIFDIELTTYCHPFGEDKLVHSPSANFILIYDASTDTLALDGTDVTYTRLP